MYAAFFVKNLRFKRNTTFSKYVKNSSDYEIEKVFPEISEKPNNLTFQIFPTVSKKYFYANVEIKKNKFRFAVDLASNNIMLIVKKNKIPRFLK